MAKLPASPSGLELLQVHFLSAPTGDRDLLAELRARIAAHPDAERLQALSAEGGGAGGAALAAGLDLRPGWVRPCLRDGKTLALSRHALRAPEGAPGVSALPREVSSLVLFAASDVRPRNDLGGQASGDELLAGVVATAQRFFGDRVVRWRGNRFLVPLEEGDPEPAFFAFAEEVARSAELCWEGRPAGVVGAIGPAPEASDLEAALEALEASLRTARQQGNRLEDRSGRPG